MAENERLPQETIDLVSDLVRKSAGEALGWFRQRELRTNTDNKAAAGYDPVTIADRAVEDALRAGIHELFPGDAVLGEERGISGVGERRWIIDPIDGTRAFVTGQPLWGVLVALYRGDEPIAGWSYMPVLDEMYVAANGTATLRGPDGFRTLRSSDVVGLDDAVLACTHPSMFAPGAEAARFWALEQQCKLSRFGGDCMNWLLLADGYIDLVVENDLYVYDVGSLIPTIEAAGGVITGLDGGPAIRGGFVVGAATPELHAAALKVLTQTA